MRSPGCHRDEHDRTGTRSEEWGFTLPELLATIAIIGIIAAIAIPSFFGIIEARRVESAANQLAGDLRLAHSRATNQVGTPWAVSLIPGQRGESVGADYYLINTVTGERQPRTLPGSTEIKDTNLVTDLAALLSGLGLPTSRSSLYFCSAGNTRWSPAVSTPLTSGACSESTSLSDKSIITSSGNTDRTVRVVSATSNIEVSP